MPAFIQRDMLGHFAVKEVSTIYNLDCATLGRKSADKYEEHKVANYLPKWYRNCGVLRTFANWRNNRVLVEARKRLALGKALQKQGLVPNKAPEMKSKKTRPRKKAIAKKKAIKTIEQIRKEKQDAYISVKVNLEQQIDFVTGEIARLDVFPF